MHPGTGWVLWSAVALAQVPRQDPLGAAIQAYWQARNDARFDEAAAKREEARGLLSRVAVGAPQYGSWAQNVAQLYQNAGISAQARAIAQEALSRADGLGQSHPARILLLNMLADFWQEDRNLLKSLVYREKAAVALDA